MASVPHDAVGTLEISQPRSGGPFYPNVPCKTVGGQLDVFLGVPCRLAFHKCRQHLWIEHSCLVPLRLVHNQSLDLVIA